MTLKLQGEEGIFRLQDGSQCRAIVSCDQVDRPGMKRRVRKKATTEDGEEVFVVLEQEVPAELIVDLVVFVRPEHAKKGPTGVDIQKGFMYCSGVSLGNGVGQYDDGSGNAVLPVSPEARVVETPPPPPPEEAPTEG